MMLFSRTCLTAGLFCSFAAAIPVEKRQAKIPVSTEFYDTISRYGNFAAASTPATCTNAPDGAVVVATINDELTATAARLFRVDSARELILAFPGTDSLEDWLVDILAVELPFVGCNGCVAHTGFWLAWESVQTPAKAALTSALQANPDYHITLVGHSLGGALANMAYGDLKSSGKYPQITGAWSFGEPRVGNQAYANFVDSLSGASDSVPGEYHRITHYNDGVPQFPAEVSGYVHQRTEYWVSAPTPAADTTYQCVGQEPADCNDGAGGGGKLNVVNQAHAIYPGLDYGQACTTN